MSKNLKVENIHPCLENPDGPWTHEDDPELNQQKIIINRRRSHRVQMKIENILEQLISGAVEKIEEDERHGSGSEDSYVDEEIESEEEDQRSGSSFVCSLFSVLQQNVFIQKKQRRS